MVIKGITAGAFDLLHPGHVLMLEEAKSHCDYLIVALHTDPSVERKNKNRPIQTTYERFVQLKACRFVDEIVPYDTERDLYNILCVLKPGIRIVGEDHKGSSITGGDLPIEVYYTAREHDYSSTELRKRLR
jgi:glycerol-3-phosphate cytidylyltransferase